MRRINRSYRDSNLQSPFFLCVSHPRGKAAGKQSLSRIMVAGGSTSRRACEPGVQLGLCKHDAAPIHVSRLTDFEVCALRVYKTREDAKVSSFLTFFPLSRFRTRLHFFDPPSSHSLQCSRVWYSLFFFSALLASSMRSGTTTGTLKAFGFRFILFSFEVLHTFVYLKSAQLKSFISPSKSTL